MAWPTGFCKEFSFPSWKCYSSSVCLHTKIKPALQIHHHLVSLLHETIYLSLMPIHWRHQGSEGQVPQRLLKEQEESWSSSESALAFIHLSACWSHTRCKPIFSWIKLLPAAPQCKILQLCSDSTDSLTDPPPVTVL